MPREVLNGKIGEGVYRRKKDDLREGLCIEKCLMGRLVKGVDRRKMDDMREGLCLEKCLMGRLVKELIGGRRMIWGRGCA